MGGASGTYRSHCWRARGTSVEPIFDSRPEYLFSIGIFMMGGVPAHMSTVGEPIFRSPNAAKWEQLPPCLAVYRAPAGTAPRPGGVGGRPPLI